MFGWLKALFGSAPTRSTRSTPAASAAKPAAPAAPAASPAPVAATEPIHAFGQRRPLVGPGGGVVGFEWRLPVALEERLLARGIDALAAHFAALLAAAGEAQAAGRQALVRIPAGLLARPGVASRAVAGTMVLPEGAPLPPRIAQALRVRGVKLGMPDGPPARAPQADFVVLRAASGGIDTLLLAAQHWVEARPGLTRVALGLDNIDDLERVLGSGIALAGGRFDASRRQQPARQLSAAAHRICVLINDLAMDRDTATVADTVRADVALSYRLLRYANSPAIGLTQGVETVERAVTLLGRAEIGRWLSVMLMSAASGRQASSALQEHALARGRLLEALATRAGVARPQSLFTVGLMSKLDLLLQMPLAAALEPLRLSDEARQALLQRQGPWVGYLELADTLEGDDEARLTALSAPFGGMEAVLDEAAKAWGWAAEVAGLQKG